jgi:hypothetical protein
MNDVLEEDNNNPFGVHRDLWRWTPTVDGPSFSRFLEADELPQSARDYLRRFTPRVLGQSNPPTTDGQATGLVIGKVQSGKTNSFLALAALASDNDFRLIIILSGTKNVLKNQTHRQVIHRLSRGQRGWRAIDFNPDDRQGFESRLQTTMSQLAPRTLVVTILKRTRNANSRTPDASGIDRLAEFIELSAYRQQLANRPTLIIDDEADEASLNARASQRRAGRPAAPTATFTAIARLRRLFNRHLFVQYTATPQANLLVELSDQLAPDFCELLQPGAGYCGAEEFFPAVPAQFVAIPSTDLQAVTAASPAPPDSLVSAVHLFYFGAAIEDQLRGDESDPPTRTMLVHPGRGKAGHTLAERWVGNVRSHLIDLLNAADNNNSGPEYRDLELVLADCVQELSKTAALPSITLHTIFPYLRARVDETAIKLVNSERQLTEEIDWEEELCWIFVGGNVLERGFAMKNLMTTWMPRPAGSGQVDVLMQRGRWFGYRADFLDFCRVWLPQDVHDDFYALFAEHERALWRSLEEHIAAGNSLERWSRVFWLDPNPNLRLCRRSTQWFRLRDQPEWAPQLWLPAPGDADAIRAAAENARLVGALLAEFSQWELPWQPPTPNAQREHIYTALPLTRLQAFFDAYAFFGENTADGAVIRDAIAVLLEADSQARGSLIQMRPNATNTVRRQQSTVPKINALQAGRSVTGGNRASLLGDTEFHAGGAGIPRVTEDLLTLQVHTPIIERAGVQPAYTAPGGYLAAGCPLVAVYLPRDVQQYRRERAGDRP